MVNFVGKAKYSKMWKLSLTCCQKEPNPSYKCWCCCCLDLQFCFAVIHSICAVLWKFQSHVSIDDYPTDPYPLKKKKEEEEEEEAEAEEEGGTFSWQLMHTTIMHQTHTLWQTIVMLILILWFLSLLFIYLFIYFYMAKIIISKSILYTFTLVLFFQIQWNTGVSTKGCPLCSN